MSKSISGVNPFQVRFLPEEQQRLGAASNVTQLMHTENILRGGNRDSDERRGREEKVSNQETER